MRKVLVLLFAFIGALLLLYLDEIKEKPKEPHPRTIGLFRLFERLPQLLAGDEKQKLEGLNILAFTRSEETVETLARLLDEPSDEVRLKAVDVLGEQATLSAVPHLIRALSDDDEDVRNAAVWALSRIQPHPSSLLRILESTERRELHISVLKLVGRLRIEEAFALVARFLSDDDTAIAEEAAKTLSLLNIENGDRRLLEAQKLTETTSPKLRLRIAEVLAHLRSPLFPEVVRPLLWHEDESVRAEVATLTGRYGLKQASELLSYLLDDESPLVREKALWALMSCRDRSLVRKVVKLLNDTNESVREVAGYILEGLCTEEMLDDVAKFLSASDPAVRETAVRVIGAASRNGKIVPLLAPLLKDEEPSVRASVVRAMGASRSSKAAALLLPLLEDEDADVRLSVLEALFNLRATKFAPKLLPLLGDPFDEVRQKAASTLLFLQSGIETTELLDYLVRPDTRAIASILIVEFADDTVAPHLLRLLTSDDTDLRKTAFQILLEMRPEGIEAELISLLKHEKASVRRSAVRLLAEVSDEDCLKHLEEVADDRISYVRQAYVEALARLGGRAAAEKLLEALDDGDYNVKMAAAAALGRMKCTEATDALIQLLKNRAPVVRRTAIKALAELRPKEALQPILELLPKATSRTKLTITEALGSFGRDALPTLISIAEDGSSIEALSAAVSIGKILASEESIPDDVAAKAEEVLLKLLEDNDYGVRDAATEALKRKRELTSKTVERLLGLLSIEGDLSERAAAVLRKHPEETVARTILSRIKTTPELINYATISLIPDIPEPARFVEPLVSTLLADPRTEIQDAIKDALVRMRTIKAAERLLPLIPEKRTWLVETVCEVVAAADHRKAIPYIKSLLSDHRLSVRTAAVKTLATLEATEAVEELIRIATAPSEPESIREEAIKALGTIRDRRSVPALLTLLEDGASALRLQSAEALGRIGAKEAAKNIVPLLTDPLGYSVAVRILKKLNNKDILPQVVELTKDPIDWTREEAVRLVGLLGDRTHLEHILPLIYDPSGRVRYAVAEALGYLGSEEHIPFLISLLGDTSNILACPCCVRDPIRGKYPTVRAIAVWSISRITGVRFEGVTERQLVADCKRWFKKRNRK